MSSPTALPLLSLLIAAPAIGSLTIALLGPARMVAARRVAAGFSLSALVLSVSAGIVFFTSRSGGAVWERYALIDVTGSGWILGLDGFSLALVFWVALAGVIVLFSGSAFERDGAIWILFAESMALGLFVARDAYLLMAFYGGLLVAVAPLASSRRRYLIFHLAGLAVCSSFFIYCYQLVAVQTGFASTELSRFQTIVLYPEARRILFHVGLAGAVFALPLAPALSWLSPVVDRRSSSARSVVTAFSSFAGSYLLFRLVLPIGGSDSSSMSGLVMAVALASLAYAALAPGRPWGRLIVGHQALVLVGIAMFHESGVVAGALQMLVLGAGATGLALSSSRAPRCFFALFLSLAPTVWIGPVLWSDSPALAAMAALAFAALMYRVWREALSRTVDEAMPRRALLSTIPIAVWCLSLVVVPGTWHGVLAPTVRALLPPSNVAEPDP